MASIAEDREQEILRVGGDIRICSTRSWHAEQLEELQKTVFPTISESHLFRAPHYCHHIELFPEGQFVALINDRVIGMTSSIRVNIDRSHHHTFEEMSQGGWLGAHDNEGSWMYGADIGTHPDFRGRGIARALYYARHLTVRDLGLKGQVTVGMLSGYGALKDEMSAEDYYSRLVSGEINDPTISAQIKIGFRPEGLIADYVEDPRCANYGVLLVLDSEIDIY